MSIFLLNKNILSLPTIVKIRKWFGKQVNVAELSFQRHLKSFTCLLTVLETVFSKNSPQKREIELYWSSNATWQRLVCEQFPWAVRLTGLVKGQGWRRQEHFSGCTWQAETDTQNLTDHFCIFIQPRSAHGLGIILSSRKQFQRQDV